MNVLSLFDGMSCGQIALREIGIIPEIYYSSEIDKFAIAQTQLNFPNTIQLGSVVNVDVSKLQPIDLLIGGSPCQSFSFAGKRKGMATKCEIDIYTLEKYLELKEQVFEFEGQSYLFWEYMRILTDIRKYNPDVKFLLENVEMGKKWERILSEAIVIFPAHINSALVSAQNRKRLYWTNIRTKEVGMFGELHSDIPQPKDRGILLKDILESEVDEKYYLSDKIQSQFKSYNTNKDVVGTTKPPTRTIGQKDEVYGVEGKMGCLVATDYKQPKQIIIAGGNSGGLHSDMDLICVAMRGRNPNNPSDRTIGAPTEQRLEPNISAKTNCLTSVQKDNLILSSRIRRLTPTECTRLQTVPDWYKWACSDTQQYRMLGNGWTCEVISHIFSFLI